MNTFTNITDDVMTMEVSSLKLPNSHTGLYITITPSTPSQVRGEVYHDVWCIGCIAVWCIGCIGCIQYSRATLAV